MHVGPVESGRCFFPRTMSLVFFLQAETFWISEFYVPGNTFKLSTVEMICKSGSTYGRYWHYVSCVRNCRVQYECIVIMNEGVEMNLKEEMELEIAYNNFSPFLSFSATFYPMQR